MHIKSRPMSLRLRLRAIWRTGLRSLFKVSHDGKGWGKNALGWIIKQQTSLTHIARLKTVTVSEAERTHGVNIHRHPASTYRFPLTASLMSVRSLARQTGPTCWRAFCVVALSHFGISNLHKQMPTCALGAVSDPPWGKLWICLNHRHAFYYLPVFATSTFS